jgi:hypothetical protein
MGISNFKNYYYKPAGFTATAFSDYLGKLDADYGEGVTTFNFNAYKNTTDTSESIKLPLYSSSCNMS